MSHLEHDQRPRGPARAQRAGARAAGPGGPRAHHRHGRGDRRALRREPRHLRARGGAPLAARIPPRQDPLGRRATRPTPQGPDRAARRSSARSASTAGWRPSARSRESPHDIMGAGHASTSIGYAVGHQGGHAPAGDGEDGKVVAVIGDGAMTGGVAFEAIGQAGGLGHADRRGAQRQRHVDRARTSARCRATSTASA